MGQNRGLGANEKLCFEVEFFGAKLGYLGSEKGVIMPASRLKGNTLHPEGWRIAGVGALNQVWLI
jgi:hypothetical protein